MVGESELAAALVVLSEEAVRLRMVRGLAEDLMGPGQPLRVVPVLDQPASRLGLESRIVRSAEEAITDPREPPIVLPQAVGGLLFDAGLFDAAEPGEGQAALMANLGVVGIQPRGLVEPFERGGSLAPEQIDAGPARQRGGIL